MWRENLENNKLVFDSSKITSMLIDQRDRKNSDQWKCKTEDSSAILNRVTYYESHQHDKKNRLRMSTSIGKEPLSILGQMI